MSKATPKQKLNVVYQVIPPDPAGKDTKQELERGFDILFDIVLKELEAEALSGYEMSRQKEVTLESRVYT